MFLLKTEGAAGTVGRERKKRVGALTQTIFLGTKTSVLWSKNKTIKSFVQDIKRH